MRARAPRAMRSGIAMLIAAGVFAALPPAPAGADVARADFHGSAGDIDLNEDVVGMAATPDGLGYWLVAADGGIFAYGPSAEFYGSTGDIELNEKIVGMAATRSGEGYWLVAADGGVFAFGDDAVFYGSTGGQAIAAEIVGIAATTTGEGYWILAADGSVYAFGDALHHGNGAAGPSPAVGIGAPSWSTGYWIVRADGTVEAFGDATWHGDASDIELIDPVVAMIPSPHGYGYWLVAADGGVFAFGPTAGFHGSAGDIDLVDPIVGGAAALDGYGYWFAASDGGVFTNRGKPIGARGPLGLTPRRLADEDAPLRAMVLGDSVALSFQDAMDARLRETGEGLALPRGKPAYGLTAAWKPVEPCIVCFAIPHYGPESLSAHALVDGFDVAVVLAGGWDIFGRRVSGGTLTPFEPAWRTWYRGLQNDAAARLTERGGVVIWIGYPGCDGTNPDDVFFNDYARALADRNDSVAYLDLQAAVCPDGPQVELELDSGVSVNLLDPTGHFTPVGARWIAEWVEDVLRPTFDLPAG